MKKVLDEQLLQREMTRKQFIKLLTLAVFSILGMNNLLAMLNRLNRDPVAPQDSAGRHGFGSSKFGA